jgi:ethylbenzene dioxygenase beta subunit
MTVGEFTNRGVDAALIGSSWSSIERTLYEEVRDWMHLEAEMLDGFRELEWLDTMVDDSIIYRVPLRQTVERVRGNGFVANAYHMDETSGSLRMRVSRLATAHAYGEDPPARTRHFVSNIRVFADDSAVRAKSNVMLCRSRGDSSSLNIMTGERQDEFVRNAGLLRLRVRTVFLDFSVIETANLATLF